MLLNAFTKARVQKPQISESSLSDNENNKSNNNSSFPILQQDSIIQQEKIQLYLPKAKSKRKIHKQKKNTKVSLPQNDNSRFTIIHNEQSEKKKLDNSYEDYFFYEIVDDNSYKIFLKLTQDYISGRINDKTMRLYNSVRRQIEEVITHGLKQIHTYPDVIQKVIMKTINKHKKKKSCFQKMCCCCCKPKEKLQLQQEYNMRETSENIANEIGGFIEDTIGKFNDKNIEQYYMINKEENEKFAKEKSKMFFNKRGVDELLRVEVENYSKYFNIEKIIEKQENTLETQSKKMNKLNETKELNECIICMEKQRNVIFYPCYHLICCEDCGNVKVKDECPECKNKIERKMFTN